MRAERDRLTVALARSQTAARRWHDSAPMRALKTTFGGLGEADVAEIAHHAHDLLEDADWAGALIAPLITELREDDWFEPPLRISRDALKTGAVLFECPAITITATILSADALAGLPSPRTLVVPGRLSIVRYVRSGDARLHLWHAGPAGQDFDAAGARPAAPVGVLPLGDGVVLRLDGRTRGWWIENAQSDVVTLTATIRAGASPLMREYALPEGSFLRCATLDDRAARVQMLLTLLRLTRRADAGDCFAAATRDGPAFLRWSAMREWLALDAAGALAPLRAMADEDASAEVREAATATLAMVEARMAERRCPA